MMGQVIARVKRGSFVNIPISDRTRGHGSQSIPALWGDELARFLDALP